MRKPPSDVVAAGRFVLLRGRCIVVTALSLVVDFFSDKFLRF